MTDIVQKNSSAMMTPDVGFEDFNLIVEGEKNYPRFYAPPRWDPQTFRVSNVTVHAHTRAAHTPTRTTTGVPLLTYHDIGQNASIAFNTLFNHARISEQCPQIDAAKAHFHITAPGHEHDECTIGTGVDVSFDALVRDVLTVLERFEIEKVIAIGIGLGASILLNAASIRPKAFTGLILISPVIYPTSFMERIGIRAESVFSKGLGLGLNRHIKDRFLARWLSSETLENNSDASQSLDESLDRLNARNLVRLLDVDAARPDLTSCISKIQAKTLLLTGKESSLCYHTEDGFPLFKPEKTTWLNITDCGSLVHDEAPEDATKAISLFLQGFPGFG